MKKVILSKSAAQYLRDETRYLRDRSPPAALRFKQRIREAKRNLQDYPNIGSSERELPVPGAQTLVTGEYLLDYTIDGEMIEIITIRSGQMKPPTIGDDIDDDYEANEIAEPDNKFTR